jgi:hypothetical protein
LDKYIETPFFLYTIGTMLELLYNSPSFFLRFLICKYFP